MATIAERHELICRNPPKLDSGERRTINAVLAGRVIESIAIRYRHTKIEDNDAGAVGASRELAARMREMSFAERIATIESFGF